MLFHLYSESSEVSAKSKKQNVQSEITINENKSIKYERRSSFSVMIDLKQHMGWHKRIDSNSHPFFWATDHGSVLAVPE